MLLRVLEWICRLLLGALFVIAGYTKLGNPFLFEMAVDTYQLLPPTGVIVVARSLPWLERPFQTQSMRLPKSSVTLPC